MRVRVADHVMDINVSAKPVVAFFDLDRTLIDGYSLSALAWQHFFNGNIGPRRFVSLGSMFIRYFAGQVDYAGMLEAVVKDIAGMPEAELTALGREAFEKRVNVYHEGRELVRAHLRCKHDVVMVTSATSFQAEPIREELDIPNICSTELEIVDGRVSGAVTPCHGEGKLRAAREYLDQTGAALEDAFFYSDSFDDLPLLEMVGNPVVVNGRSAILTVCEERGWPSLEFFDKEGR